MILINVVHFVIKQNSSYCTVGVLMGMSNTWATIPGFLGPQVVGWLTDKHVSTDLSSDWTILFDLRKSQSV